MIEDGAPLADAECGTLPSPAAGRNENFLIDFYSTTYGTHLKRLRNVVRCGKRCVRLAHDRARGARSRRSSPILLRGARLDSQRVDAMADQISHR
ncbi:MAG TPA: hypothetical protein VF217_02585, partial [Rhodanobacteraceae bacterium]